MAKKISRDTPLNEITFRRYEKPGKVSGRGLVRMFCLSVGLLQPGDSRDVVVDILYVLLKARNQKKLLTSEEIVERVINARKRAKQPMLGIASSNVRRQLMRLRDLYLVEKVKNSYRITEFLSLSEIFDHKVKRFLLESTLERVEEYVKKVDGSFKRKK
jgi:DNA-binding transcriptional ArsR family regulator